MSKIIELQPREINSIGGGEARNPFVVGGKIFGVVICLGLLGFIIRATIQPLPNPNPDETSANCPFIATLAVFAGFSAIVGVAAYFLHPKSKNDIIKKNEKLDSSNSNSNKTDL